jgi:hypothetical protein
MTQSLAKPYEILKATEEKKKKRREIIMASGRKAEYKWADTKPS